MSKPRRLDLHLTKIGKYSCVIIETTRDHTELAKELGVYEILYRPAPGSKAKVAIGPLNKAISKLAGHTVEYEYDPIKSFDNCDRFLKFLREARIACENHPNTELEAYEKPIE